MLAIKIFKLHEENIVVCVNNNFYNTMVWQNSSDIHTRFSDSFMTKDNCCALPRHNISLFRIDFDVNIYIDVLSNKFNREIANGELEIQYTDLQDKIAGYENVVFVRRNLGVFVHQRLSDGRFTSVEHSMITIDNFNNKKIKAFNI